MEKESAVALAGAKLPGLVGGSVAQGPLLCLHPLPASPIKGEVPLRGLGTIPPHPPAEHLPL